MFAYIEKLFKAILTESAAIKGRFYVCSAWGDELGTSNLGQLVGRTAPDDIKKYPLAILMPPRIQGDFSGDQAAAAQVWTINMLFLCSTYSEAGKINSLDSQTNSSTHTIVQTWHDMQRVATNFVRIVNKLVEEKTGLINSFRLFDQTDHIITPVSNISGDAISGVNLQFACVTFMDCEIEDYDGDTIVDTITLPDPATAHPEHSL